MAEYKPMKMSDKLTSEANKSVLKSLPIIWNIVAEDMTGLDKLINEHVDKAGKGITGDKLNRLKLVHRIEVETMIVAQYLLSLEATALVSMNTRYKVAGYDLVRVCLETWTQDKKSKERSLLLIEQLMDD